MKKSPKRSGKQRQKITTKSTLAPIAQRSGQPQSREIKPLGRLGNSTPFRPEKRRWWERGSFVVGIALIGVVGTLLAALALLPHPMVDAGQPLSGRDASSAVFYVSNTGLIPLEKVTASVAICRFSILAGDCSGYRSRLVMQTWEDHTLREDDKFPIAMSDLFNTGGAIPANADIAISVDYSPWMLPFILTKQFKFISKVAPDGTVSWVPMPLK